MTTGAVWGDPVRKDSNVRFSSRRRGLRGLRSARTALGLGCAVALACSATGALAVPIPRLTYISAPASTTANPQLMLALANGAQPRSLGPASTAVLSPNGAFVAAISPGAGSPAHGSTLELYAVGSKKAPRTLRTSSAQLTILAWSPDARWIAVTDGNSLVAIPLHGTAHALATGTIAGASFSPRTPDKLVFAEAASLAVGAQVNLYTISVNGGTAAQLTRDGLSEYPIWGPQGIIYSHEQSQSTTTLQLWLLTPSGHTRPLTDLTVNAQFNGLEPVALSQNGMHLLANLVGDNTSQAWCIDLSTTPVAEHALGAAGTTTIGNAISRNGAQVLLTEGTGTLSGDDFSKGAVAVVPWSGGNGRTLAEHSAFASWDR